MVRKLQYQIDSKDHGKTIAMFLKEREYSRGVIIELKKSETGIRKNDQWVYVNEPLEDGDLLEICLTEEESSDKIIPIARDLDILYEDEDLLIVNKPHNTPVHPSINNYENTLANGVVHYYQKQNKKHVFRCMNRLDRDTTGAVIIAKNLLSAAILSSQVQEKTLQRTYLALVEGHINKEGTVDLPIGREEGSIIKRQVDEENGKHAITHYKREEVYHIDGKEISLVSLQLETGRTHQIRVHMSHIGHPLLGDFLYNATNTMLSRQALHSSKLGFIHPISREYHEIIAPIPKDMKSICNK